MGRHPSHIQENMVTFRFQCLAADMFDNDFSSLKIKPMEVDSNIEN